MVKLSVLNVEPLKVKICEFRLTHEDLKTVLETRQLLAK